MAESGNRYFAVLTDAGAALEARALESGKGIVLTHIAVGDANLREVTPDISAAALVHEVCRRPIDARSRDESDPAITLLHATILAEVGGFWIYEMGVVGHLEGEEEEVLYAYANHSRYYKMLPADGQTITHELTIPVIQCTDAQVSIQVADSGYATRKEVLLISSLVEALRNMQRAAWVQAEAVAQGAEMALPQGLAYIPGCRVVQLSWCGVACHLGRQFEESAADEDGYARSVKMLFPIEAGDELEVLIHGHSDALPLEGAEGVPSGLAGRVQELEYSVENIEEQLSSVAYLEELAEEAI